MDSLTQIVLGASVAEATLGKKIGNKAIVLGAIAGTIPDLDIVTRFFVDDLTASVMHRGFSHSLIFPFVNTPDDLPWPEYSIAKKPNLIVSAYFLNAAGFSPSISDIKPGRKTMYSFFL